MTDDVVIDSNNISNEESDKKRFILGPVGYTGLREVGGYIYEESKTELRWPYAGVTYRKMMMDPTIASVTNFVTMMLAKVPWKIVYNPDVPNAKEASEFLSYCKDNMEDMTWRDFITDLVHGIFLGFSVNEKIFTKVSSGEWEGKIKIKGLPSRPQDTLTGWVYNDRGDKLLGVKQNPIKLDGNIPTGEVDIPRVKFIHFTNNRRSSNPEGTALLKGCYFPWKQKVLAEELELVGMTKDLAGIVTIGVDAEYLARAAENPNGYEAKNIEQMKKDAANLSAGEQSYVIKPIAYTETGKELFSFKLTGIEGTGKQYSTQDVIQRKQNEIFTVFLADVLKLGQDGSGSYALSDSKNNILALSLQYFLSIFSEKINKELTSQLLALNGWRFKAGEMPTFVPGDVDDRDLEGLSKFIQRTVSVGAVSVDKDLDNALRNAAGLPEANYEAPMPLNEGDKSRAGDGMATTGPGTSNSPKGVDTSVSNNENT